MNLSTFSDKKSCNTSTTLQNSVAQFVSNSWASCISWLTLSDMYTVLSVGVVHNACATSKKKVKHMDLYSVLSRSASNALLLPVSQRWSALIHTASTSVTASFNMTTVWPTYTRTAQFYLQNLTEILAHTWYMSWLFAIVWQRSDVSYTCSCALCITAGWQAGREGH